MVETNTYPPVDVAAGKALRRLRVCAGMAQETLARK